MADAISIVEYVEKNWKTFDEEPVNEVDSLVFCQLSYLRIGETFPDAKTLDGMALKDFFKAECQEAFYGGMRDTGLNRRLIPALASSPRFREVRASLYVNEIDAVAEKQFSATCFRLTDGSVFVAFRGTDTSLIGWKEDFNLAVQYPVPAQMESLAYLNMASAAISGDIYVGGHSKGGNLATYSVMKTTDDVRARIKRVFDHDAPGFSHDVVSSDEFARIEPLVSKTVPQGSVFGLLFESVGEIRVVKSDGVGIMQHDPFTWQVDLETSSFAIRGKLDAQAAYGNSALEEWIAGMSETQREQFISALFEVFSTDGATDFREGDNLVTIASLAKGFALADDTVRSALIDNIGSLLRIATTPQNKVESPASVLERSAEAIKNAVAVSKKQGATNEQNEGDM